MKRSKTPKRIRAVARNCHFCNQSVEPDYKDVTLLSKYLTERGKLLGRSRSGLCSKHQRAMERSVKHARHVAMLPFVVRA